MSQDLVSESEKTKKKTLPVKERVKGEQAGSTADLPALTRLQKKVGNRAVQRLIAQRADAFSQGGELDDETASHIQRQRGAGQPLDSQLQAKIQQASGQDFSGVKVHTSPEADALNRQLSATAFTTGQDIFFRDGAYDPHSNRGQELVAHELTHIVQQSSGAVGSGAGRMTVNPPGDVYEQEADAAARQLTMPGTEIGTQTGLQRQVGEEEEEETVQRQADEEEEEETVQRQVSSEEEEEEVQE